MAEMAAGVGSGGCEGVLANPSGASPQPSSSGHPPSGGSQRPSEPSLSYVALIAKVILSSLAQKLNLASICGAMEERFPHLRSRRPGWRNSVRHSLSVNTCFVKLSRCEGGRGHHWGVHRAHLRDFQQGNFRQCRKAKRRRRQQRPRDTAAACLAWMESCCCCLLGRLRVSGRVERRRPLQEPSRHQRGLLAWAGALYHPWSLKTAWEDASSWMGRDYFPGGALPGSCGAGIGRPLTSGLRCCKRHDPALSGMRESHGKGFTAPPLHLLTPPACWRVAPVMPELLRPPPHKVDHQRHSRRMHEWSVGGV